MKRCAACGETKPVEEFGLKKGRPGSWCKACCREKMREDRQRRPEHYRELSRKRQPYGLEWAKRRRQELRDRVLTHYGARCVCCGETERAFLVIDHINGGGNQHRRSVSGTYGISQWIIKNGFPDDLQVLCANCNMAKEYAPNGCPHQHAPSTLPDGSDIPLPRR